MAQSKAIKLLVNTFFMLACLCVPFAIAGAWIDLRGGPPSFLTSWLLGGFGGYFLLGPKPLLFPLAFLLDPVMWIFAWQKFARQP